MEVGSLGFLFPFLRSPSFSYPPLRESVKKEES
jgi:hypothetical protein